MLFQASPLAQSPNIQDRRVLYPSLMKTPRTPPASSSRIVGGQEAEPNSYPFIVALSIDDTYFCGGTILGEAKEIYHLNTSVFNQHNS